MQRDAVDPPVTSQMEPTPRGSPSSCALPPSIRDLRELVTTELEDAANRFGDIADIAEGGASLTAIASYARKCQARMLAALTQADREPDWTPTPSNVNALPEPIRSFIHQLETRCDPSGDTRELVIARDTIKALERLVAELTQADREQEKKEEEATRVEGQTS